tara:strand:- start:340 stop:783 length:444 start_codon:yes stop_codon:yes gene_type:complete
MSLSKIKELEPKKDKPVSITGLEKILHVTFELQEQTLSCSVVSRILNMESKLKRDRACALLSGEVAYDDLPLSGKLRIWALATLSEALIDPPEWLNEWIGRFDPLLFKVYAEVEAHERDFFRIDMEASGEEAESSRVKVSSIDVTSV